MKTSKLLIPALLVCALSLPAFGQVTDTYVVTAAARLNGNNGTQWLTQLSLFNPHLEYELNISVTFVPTGGAQGIEKLIELPKNATFVTDDVLRDVFNTSGSGSLLLATFPEDNPGVADDVTSRSFLVTSQTYNNDPSGTYGQTIPGVWTGLLDIDTDGITSIAHGIDNSTRLKYRTNIGATNLGRCSVTMYVSVYDADGRTLVKEAPFFVPPLAHWQDRLPVQVEGGSVEFFVDDPCANDDAKYAVVFPYTSTIDDLSGDPKYQTPVLLASPGLIYGKKAVQTDSLNVGKKIDTTIARAVREKATRSGTVQLKRGGRGWVVDAR